MNTRQINTLLRSDPVSKQFFGGTFPCDKIPPPHTYDTSPLCFVVNHDVSTKPGSHWVAIFIAPKKCYYFNAYGGGPNLHVRKYLKKHYPHFEINKVRIQGLLASTCGHYCVYFCQMACRGQTMEDILKRFDASDAVSNDIVITKYINTTFDVSFPTYDKAFLVEQISKSLA